MASGNQASSQKLCVEKTDMERLHIINVLFQPAGIQRIGKSWTFLMGVLAVILSTTALIMAAIKFPMWYRYLKSYNHRRLQEKEESELFEETFTPQLCMPSQASETNEEESIVVFEQFRPYVPEDDGFIEDKYIDP